MNSLKRAKIQGNEFFPAPVPVVDEDETSLIALWLGIVRRKRVILDGLPRGVTVAAAFPNFLPEEYRFFTTSFWSN